MSRADTRMDQILSNSVTITKVHFVDHEVAARFHQARFRHTGDDHEEIFNFSEAHDGSCNRLEKQQDMARMGVHRASSIPPSIRPLDQILRAVVDNGAINYPVPSGNDASSAATYAVPDSYVVDVEPFLEQAMIERARAILDAARRFVDALLEGDRRVYQGDGVGHHWLTRSRSSPCVLVLVTCPSESVMNEHLVCFPIGQDGTPRTDSADTEVLSFTFGSLENHLDEQPGTIEAFGGMVEYHRRDAASFVG